MTPLVTSDNPIVFSEQSVVILVLNGILMYCVREMIFAVTDE